MGLEINTFKEVDLSDREVLEILNEIFIYDHIDIELYRRTIRLDPNHSNDEFFFYTKNSEIIGVAYITYLKEKSSAFLDNLSNYVEHVWLKLLGVIPGKEEFLDQLIDYVEDYVRSRNKKIIHVYGYAPFYFAPGIDRRYEIVNKTLLEKGYKLMNRVVNYYVDLDDYYVPLEAIWLQERISSEGYVVREINIDEYDRVIECIRDKFGVIWGIESLITKNYECSGIIIVEDKNGEIIGFNTYGASAPYRYGPVGVWEKYRGKGFGKVLLHYTLNKMRKLGLRIVEIPWTTHLFYYAGIPGLNKIRLFNIYVKKLIKSKLFFFQLLCRRRTSFLHPS